MIARRAMGLAAAAIVLTACATDSSPSATPSLAALSQLPTPSPTASPSPTATPSPTPVPTPKQADIPRFAAGAIVTPRVTVRLRDLPGTQWGVAANLRPGARVQVVLGPILTGGFGWYLVRDVDPAAPSFREGWVAAGFAPNAFLSPQPSATPPPNSPTFVASYAGVTDGHFGPFHLEGSTALRWAIAVPTGMPSGAACAFTGTLSTGGQSVTFLKTSAGQTPAPGTVQPSFFANHPALHGDLFLGVASDCSWAVSVVRLPL
ncbi:MAG: SH3 domain-containing protein [Chloroflexota bacterium]|nr:SH3 domain-containing protein [Chloroflexota bacterium]